MKLTKKQKDLIKKRVKYYSLDKIAQELKIDRKEIKKYLKKIWRNKKYQKFISKNNRKNHLNQKLNKIKSLNLKTFFIQNWRIFVFLTFLVLSVYYNSLGNDFVSDDISAIKNHPKINSVNYFLQPPYFNIHPRLIIIFIIHKIFGLNPSFYHLSNILFHLGSSWIIFILITLFFQSPIPLITAGIFAVHPIETEAVTWISGGPYSFAAFFALSSILSYVLAKNHKAQRIYVISIFLFTIAISSLPKLIILPVILLLYELSLGNLKTNWKKLIPFWLVSILKALSLLGPAKNRITALESNFYQNPGTTNPLIQIPIAISSYLKLIFWPKNLTLYHSEMVFSQGAYFLRLAIFLLFLASLAFFWKKNRKLFFWLSFFLISLSLTLTPLKIAWVVAERYVYLGSLGIFVLIAWLIQKIGHTLKNKKISYLIFALLVLALSIRTISRNKDWKNQDTLWLATAKTSPSSPQNHNNLGDYYGRHGNLKKAAEEFKRAIKLKPNYGDAYHNLANTYHQMKKDDLAIKNYQKALSFNPNIWQSYQNLAAIYFNQKKFSLAEKNLKEAIRINSQNANLYLNLGIVYLKLNKKEEARQTLQNALKLDPQNQKAKKLFLSL